MMMHFDIFSVLLHFMFVQISFILQNKQNEAGAKYNFIGLASNLQSFLCFKVSVLVKLVSNITCTYSESSNLPIPTQLPHPLY